MPKVSFRMASASRESVFGVQTNTARKIHRSDHTEGRLTTAPSGCCVRKGTLTGHFACSDNVEARKRRVSADLTSEMGIKRGIKSAPPRQICKKRPRSAGPLQ